MRLFSLNKTQMLDRIFAVDTTQNTTQTAKQSAKRSHFHQNSTNRPFLTPPQRHCRWGVEAVVAVKRHHCFFLLKYIFLIIVQLCIYNHIAKDKKASCNTKKSFRPINTRPIYKSALQGKYSHKIKNTSYREFSQGKGY